MCLSLVPLFGAWAESCPVDSVITTNKDDLCTVRTLYQYDEAGRTILEQTIRYTNTGAVSSGTKSTTAYYSNGKVQETATWTWSSAKNDWIGTEKIEYTYYSNGKIEWQRIYSWGNNDWEKKYAAYYEYSGTKQILVINYIGSNNEWVANTRFENQYDTNGREILAVSYSSYNVATQIWIGDKKTVSAYDQWGYQTLDERYSSWSNGVWIGSYKVEYEFDADGNKLMTANYVWDGTNKKWKGTNKEKKVLDADERLLQLETYIWQNDTWVGQQKIEYTYDNPAVTVTSVWSNNAWVYASRESITTTDGKTTLELSEKYINGQWVGNTKTTYTYTAGKLTDKSSYIYSGSEWQIQKQEQHIYTAGKLMQDISYQWINGVKTGINRTDYEYTGGIKTKTTTYIWDNTIPDWIISGYVQFTYSNKQLTEEVEYSFIGGVAVGLTRKTYTYGEVVSTTTYTWNASTSSWNIADYTAQNYASGVLVSEEHCTYTNGVQTGGDKTVYNGNVTTTLIWNNGWVNQTRTTKTYTAGILTNELTEVWSGSAWTNSKQYILETNSYGETTLETHSEWQGGKWVVVEGTKMEKTYNSKDKVTMEAHYTWSSGVWAGVGNKEEYTYDTWGNIIQTIKSKWDVNSWKYSSKTDWKYDAVGNMLLIMTWTSWNSINGWRGGSKTENSYNATGGQTMYAYYSWSTSRKDWEGISKYDYILDDKNNKIGDIEYSWNSTKWTFVPNTKKTYTYDAAGNVTQTIKYSYNQNSKIWTESSKTNTTYDTKGNIINQYTYSWSNSQWVLTKSIEKIYDEEAPYKLRTESTINKNKSTGAITSATINTYHYACDPHITITTLASPEDGGTIVGGGNHKAPATVTLTATPAPNCYTFKQWSDGVTSPSRVVTTSENVTYTAEFTPVIRTITASVKDNIGGTVKINIER